MSTDLAGKVQVTSTEPAVVGVGAVTFVTVGVQAVELPGPMGISSSVAGRALVMSAYGAGLASVIRPVRVMAVVLVLVTATACGLLGDRRTSAVRRATVSVRLWVAWPNAFVALMLSG
jgi:hypothetical protein